MHGSSVSSSGLPNSAPEIPPAADVPSEAHTSLRRAALSTGKNFIDNVVT